MSNRESVSRKAQSRDARPAIGGTRLGRRIPGGESAPADVEDAEGEGAKSIIVPVGFGVCHLANVGRAMHRVICFSFFLPLFAFCHTPESVTSVRRHNAIMAPSSSELWIVPIAERRQRRGTKVKVGGVFQMSLICHRPYVH
ncbi:hypothetical protein CMUS01_01620 [Colletotrichum musicola]|uniref:Uncharacterized protein n=1 Tax=Colletotrichum musicola TaxID=2175873 RepID=A0A8H6NWY5_9PEZI|nr:hypothetical protein CMUS01_01620 [Colletotrichum musicola]